jgi:cell wall-associated NlpC family hydrolase
MQYGICLLSIIPCRKEADNCSEMVTQLLFGDIYSVLESNENWHKIKIEFDQYECWINKKQHVKLSEANFKQILKSNITYTTSITNKITDLASGVEFIVPIGAKLPFYTQGKIVFENHSFQTDATVIEITEKRSSKSIIDYAKKLLRSPYLWGGKSPFGIDCSGFTQLVFQLNGYSLPRDASQQVELGTPLNFVEEAEAGDLAFFDNEEGKIIHVGILLDNENVIHASGTVRIDRFDHYGIHNSDTKKYSHTLRVIKRMI